MHVVRTSRPKLFLRSMSWGKGQVWPWKAKLTIFVPLKTDEIGQIFVHNTCIPVGYGGRMIAMFQYCSLAPKCWPVTGNDLEEVTNQDWWSDLGVSEMRLFDSYRPLWRDLFALLEFSIVFQWIGHGLISDLGSMNKKILDMHLLQSMDSHHMQTFKTIVKSCWF